MENEKQVSEQQSKTISPKIMSMESLLTIKHFRRNPETGEYYEIVEDRRVEKNRCVTTAGVNYMVDDFQTWELLMPLLRYHDSGTGTDNEAVGDTALQLPCGENRDTGTLTEGASANIFKTVATHTYAGTFDITEHGIFSALTSGTLWDRTKFTAVPVVASDQLQFSYECTVNAGG